MIFFTSIYQGFRQLNSRVYESKDPRRRFCGRPRTSSRCVVAVAVTFKATNTNYHFSVSKALALPRLVIPAYPAKVSKTNWRLKLFIIQYIIHTIIIHDLCKGMPPEAN